MATFITPDQPQFRGRNDDGNETTASWKAAVNTNFSQLADVNFRLRLTVQSLVGATANSPISPTLYVSRNGGSYQAVTSSSTIARLFTSSNVTDLTSTTQQLSSGIGTFATGSVNTSSSTAASSTITPAGNPVTEDEWCLQIRSVDTSPGDTITFQSRSGTGTAFPSYTVTPSITIQTPVIPPPTTLGLGSITGISTIIF